MTTPASNSKGVPEFVEPVVAETVKPQGRSPFSVRKGATVSNGSTPDTTPKDTPPKTRKRATGSGSATAKSTDEIPYQAGVIQAGLEGMYSQFAMLVGMFDPDIAQAIVMNTQAMAASMENLAKESPATRAVLNKMVATSAVGQVIAAHTPVAMVIAVKYIPAIRNRVNPTAPPSPDSGPASNTKAV